MEPLLDPYDDRKVKDVEPPPYLPLKDELMWNSDGVPNWETIREHVRKEGKISKDNMVKLIGLATDIIKKEPNVVYMQEPV